MEWLYVLVIVTTFFFSSSVVACLKSSKDVVRRSLSKLGERLQGKLQQVPGGVSCWQNDSEGKRSDTRQTQRHGVHPAVRWLPDSLLLEGQDYWECWWCEKLWTNNLSFTGLVCVDLSKFVVIFLTNSYEPSRSGNCCSDSSAYHEMYNDLLFLKFRLYVYELKLIVIAGVI